MDIHPWPGANSSILDKDSNGAVRQRQPIQRGKETAARRDARQLVEYAHIGARRRELTV
jgi:hypothetical protein